MDQYTMIVLIVLIVVGSRIWTKSYRQPKKMLDDPRVESLELELEDLRSRVAVLEEIVTDQKYDLRSQLDALERQA